MECLMTKQWMQYFSQRYGEVPLCEICDQTLEWYSGHVSKSVHFDHKDYDVAIQGSPQAWIRKHVCSDKNIAILEV